MTLNKILLTTALYHLPAFANTPSAARGTFGLVDMQRVILSVKEGKDELATLKVELDMMQKKFMEKEAELKKMSEDFEQQQSLLTDEAKMKKQKEFQQKYVAAKEEEGQFQKSFKEKEARATQKIAEKAARLVEEMGARSQFEAVFEVRTTGILYMRNKEDITDQVIEAYDHRYGINNVGKLSQDAGKTPKKG
jgi:outer membrane protein